MKSSSNIHMTTLLLLAAVATGCKAVDDANLASMESLTDDTYRITDATLDEDSSDSESANVQPVSYSISDSMPVIHTLEAGENLDAIMADSTGVVLLDFYAGLGFRYSVDEDGNMSEVFNDSWFDIAYSGIMLDGGIRLGFYFP